MKNQNIEQYWQQYLNTLPHNAQDQQITYTAEAFGDSPAMANELGQLIVAGTKTATCSALWEWEADGDPLPQVGDKTIILDGNSQPLCIIEVTEVAIRPYNQVDAQFAYEEGEGDRSLAYWQDAHWRFFTRTLAMIDKEPQEDMPLVCERFRVIFP